MIRFCNVTKQFGRATVVEDFTLNIAAGESVALWGANGAGKTTLIRCVLGLLRFHGSIQVGPHDVARQGKQARMLIGYVPQELGFYDDLGVSEAIHFFGRLKHVACAGPDRVLSDVGLRGHERKRIRDLSGGMKQRLALAIALLGDPRVLVLDEVTASLDACGREELVALLSRLAGEGRTMLFASHRIEEVAALANRVVTLEHGRIAAVNTASAFVAHPDTGLVLHLVMPPAAREPALARLRDRGFHATMNGVGVLVPVAADQKAAPFRVLADARIAIDDFEVVSNAVARRKAHGTSQEVSS